MPDIAVADIVAFLGPAAQAVVGPVDRTVAQPAPIGEVTDAGTISFCTRTGDAAAATLAQTRAEVVLVHAAELPALEAVAEGRTLIGVAEPRLWFLRLVGRFFVPERETGIHPSAVIHPEARLGRDVSVGPLAYIGRCTVGDGSTIAGSVYLYDGVTVGRHVTIHAGTVIGADGYGYELNEHGQLEKFPHIGGVTIEDDVEIGANACIDRGTLGQTRILTGAKIDNLVHIAHNVTVGRHAAVIALTLVGGSTSIGDGAWIAPSAVLRNNIRIGDRATVGLGAVVAKDVPDGATVMGSPARDADTFKRQMKALAALVEGD